MYGYKVLKGRQKEYDEGALYQDVLGGSFEASYKHEILSVVSRRTAFNIDWLFLNTLHTLHGNETFSSLATAYNDFLNDSYEPTDSRRLEMNEERAKEGFLTYWYLELSQR